MIPNVANISQNLTPQEAFKNPRTDELRFYSFFHFFAKRGKSVEKMVHKKKNKGHRTSKIVKFR